jgi:hypothetical protein
VRRSLGLCFVEYLPSPRAGAQAGWGAGAVAVVKSSQVYTPTIHKKKAARAESFLLCLIFAATWCVKTQTKVLTSKKCSQVKEREWGALWGPQLGAWAWALMGVWGGRVVFSSQVKSSQVSTLHTNTK